MRGEQTPRLREALEDDIVAGRLKPGQRLDEVGLAERFGVSRTPIREALIQLSASGLVEIRPRRGAFVVLLGPRELIESFELMAEIEAACGRLAVQRMGPSDRDAIAATHEACRMAVAMGNEEDYYPANARFHAAIYAATGNRVLAGEALKLQRGLQPYRRLQLKVPRRVEASFAEHQGPCRRAGRTLHDPSGGAPGRIGGSGGGRLTPSGPSAPCESRAHSCGLAVAARAPARPDRAFGRNGGRRPIPCCRAASHPIKEPGSCATHP